LSLAFAFAAQSIASPACAAESAAPPPDAQPDAASSDAAPPIRGWQLGARVAYALPFGPVSSGSTPGLNTRMSDLETATVPLAIDGGFRLSRAAYLGGTLVWGPGIAPNSGGCPSNDSCFRQTMQARVEARLYPDPRKSGWWLAFATGWEASTFSQGRNGSSVTRTFSGPVLADLEIGVDTHRDFPAIGPYFGLGFVEYLSQGLNPAAAPVSTWIPSPGLHAWVTLGLRGTLRPW
jgi:hypothetical protein